MVNRIQEESCDEVLAEALAKSLDGFPTSNAHYMSSLTQMNTNKHASNQTGI